MESINLETKAYYEVVLNLIMSMLDSGEERNKIADVCTDALNEDIIQIAKKENK